MALCFGFLVLLFVIGGVAGGIFGSQEKEGDEGSAEHFNPADFLNNQQRCGSKQIYGQRLIQHKDRAKYIYYLHFSRQHFYIRHIYCGYSNPRNYTNRTDYRHHYIDLATRTRAQRLHLLRLYTFRSQGVKSHIAVDPIVFYYIRAAPEPGSQNLIVDTATNPNTPDTHWRIVQSYSDSELYCSTTAQTYWISNAFYGEGLILGLDKNCWANWQSSDTPVDDSPLQPKEIEDEGRHWYSSTTGIRNATRYKMLNLGSSSEASGMRVVLTVHGWLGVMDEVMQPKSVSVDEWQIQELG